MNNGYYPYSVGINNRNFAQELKVDNQIQKYKNEEEQQKADPILPYELEHINQYLSDVFTTLTQLRRTLQAAKRNSQIDKQVISSIGSKIDNINKIILDIPRELDIIGL